MGVLNPVHEEDITVDAVYFVAQNGEEIGHVEASEMNRAGRLFVQFLEKMNLTDERMLYIEWSRHPSLLNAGVGHDFFRVNKSTSLLIEWHFAELYDDARERSRTLITGLRDAAFVGLVYKS